MRAKSAGLNIPPVAFKLLGIALIIPLPSFVTFGTKGDHRGISFVVIVAKVLASIMLPRLTPVHE